jgi:hypothetical protein
MRRGMNRGERATDRGTTSGDRMLGSSRLARLRCGLPLTRKKLRSLASMHQPYRRRAARHQASRRNARPTVTPTAAPNTIKDCPKRLIS